MLIWLSLINKVSELLELFVTNNPTVFTALGHWSYSVSCNELLCAHFKSSHLFHSDYSNEMTTWSCMPKGNPQTNRTPSFCASWIIRAFHSSSRKWRWATPFWILLDLLQSCIGSLPFTYSYMHNADIHVLLAQTNVIYSLSFQEPLLVSSLKHSSKFNLHENILELTLLILLINHFYLNSWEVSKIHKSRETVVMNTSCVVITHTASTDFNMLSLLVICHSS